jgi:DNA polymerase-3 subunit beta
LKIIKQQLILNSQGGKVEMMEARVSTKDLTKILKLCEGVADSKATMSVLSTVLIKVDPKVGSLEFLATDLDQGFKGKVQGEIEGEVEEVQSFCVPAKPAKKFYEVIKNFPEDEVLLVKEDSRLIVRDSAEKITYELALGDASEFPVLPDFDEGEAVEVPGYVLSLLIEKAAFASSKDKNRFVLSGILFEVLRDEGKLRAVASDGHRLALFETEVADIDKVKFSSFILPRESAEEVMDFSEDEPMVKLAFINNYVVLWTSLGVFFSRTIEGSFPDYRAVIPREFERVAKIDRKQFIEALKRVSLMLTEKFKPVFLIFDKGELIVESKEVEMGQARERLYCEYAGEKFSIVFNASYLLDALQVMEADEVEMRMGDGSRPAVLLDPRQEGFLYVVMPMVL